MKDYQKYINALRKCAEEHEGDRTFTGNIIVSNLCRDTANLLEELISSENQTIQSMEDLNDNEKFFLKMLFNIGDEIMKGLDGFIDFPGGEYFTSNDFFNLKVKLGLEE